MSNAIGCMSEGNISFIKKHNPEIAEKKLHLLPNWGDISPLMTQKEVLELKKKEGFEGKFLLIFGGNIGLPQKMENIVYLAMACNDMPDIQFLIVGKGNERKSLENLIASNKITNIELRESIPAHQYFKLVQVADVGLISLSEDFTIPNIPSKALSYYNAKKPILASIDKNTDFGKILEDHGTGLWAEAGNTLQLKEKLMVLYNDPVLRTKMGENGRRYMEDELSAKTAYQTLVDQSLKA